MHALSKEQVYSSKPKGRCNLVVGSTKFQVSSLISVNLAILWPFFHNNHCLNIPE